MIFLSCHLAFMNSPNIRLQYLVIFIAILLLVIKVGAYGLTHSNTILSDAFESIVNVIMAILGLGSLYIAAQPKDENHPYGHGKIEFVYASVEGLLIILAGGGIILKSIYNFFNPIELTQIDWGIGLIALTGFINFILGQILQKQGKKSGSATLISSAKHLLSDAITTVGLVIGLGLVYFFDLKWLDNILAIGFGAYIAYMGIQLIRNSLSGIMDEVDESLLEEVVEVLENNRKENWIDVHNLRIIRFGADLHLDLHLTLPSYFSLEESHQEVENVERLMQQKVAPNIEMFIHTDPCLPNCCSLCNKQNCPIRSMSFTQKIKWTKDIVRINQKHVESE